MKPEKQRIAIAEACGRVFRDGGNFAGVAQKLVEPPHGRLTHIMTHKAAIRSTPDYLNDLNAMAEAETCEAIQRVGYAKYIECLAIACGTERLGALVFATSAQRAEAFLRTIGEWEE